MTVDFATAAGTATAGSDYLENSGVLTFAAGETRQTFGVQILDDTAVDVDETITLTLSNPVGAGPAGPPDLGNVNPATLTVVDNDSVVGFTLSDYSVNENNTNAVVTLSRTGGTVGAIAVNVATSDNTAIAGLDYVSTNATVIFGDGVASQAFVVTLLDDLIPESNESLRLTLSTPVGATTLGTSTANLVIVDDELASGELNFLSSAVSVSESQSLVTFTVTRTAGIRGVISVDYTAVNVTAVAGQDYVQTSGSLSFADGETSKSFQVPIINDVLGEGDETLNLILSNARGGATLGPQAAATMTIRDNDISVSLSTAVLSVSEGATNAVIGVIRTGGTNTPVSATYATALPAGSTAIPATTPSTPGQDFIPVSGQVSFAAGETSKFFTVPILNDAVVEADDTFEVQLFNFTGGSTPGLSTNTVVTIIDDDINISFASSAFSVSEDAGVAVITVNRIGVINSSVSVGFATTSGSAIAGLDYANRSGTLFFGAGVNSQTFTVALVDDQLVEPDELLNLILTGPSGGVALGSPNRATLTILDDEIIFNFSLSNYTVGELDATINVKVVRSGNPNVAAFVDLETLDGVGVAAANSATDYTAISPPKRLNFMPGQTEITEPINILPDSVPEPDETFRLALSGASLNAFIEAPGEATVTIEDSANSISFMTNSVTVDEAAGMATVTLVRTEDSPLAVTVDVISNDLSPAAGAATAGPVSAGGDYTSVFRTITFLPGEVSKPVTVAIENDNLLEGDEQLNLTLSNPTGNANLGSANVTTLTILDNDSQAQFAVGAANVNEAGNSLVVNVTRIGATNQAVVVDYATANATAFAGADYVAKNGSLTFAAGETNQTITIDIINDTEIEPNETFSVSLAVPAGPAPEISLAAPATVTVTIIENDFLTIVAAGLGVVTESIAPNNGRVDPGEDVTVGLGLHNIGNVDSPTVFATLMTSGGVTVTTPQTVNYGPLPNLAGGGAPVTNNFTFTAGGGPTITATLALEDRSGSTPVSLGMVNFVIDLGNTVTYMNRTPINLPGTITVPGAGPGSPYPSTIVVSNAVGSVSNVAVTLNNLNHTFPDDLDALLVSPSGQKVMLMSDAGGGGSLVNITLTIDDSASGLLQDEGQIISSTVKPANFGGVPDVLSNPAPLGPYENSMSAFSGGTPNGNWSLFIEDDAGNDQGILLGGWSLKITTIITSAVDVAVTGTSTPEPVIVGNPLAYTLTVTNSGPNAATGVVLTNVLPAGVVHISSSASQGACAINGSVINCNLGTIGVGSFATVSINVTAPAAAGLVTNRVNVASAETDSNAANNSVAIGTTVNGVTVNFMPPSGLPGGTVGIMVSGTVGKIYVIEASDDLIVWTPIQTVTAVNGAISIMDNVAGMDRRFYRTREQ